MAYKNIPFTEITIEDGKEVSRRESSRGETTCDFCGKILTYPENDERCTDCGKNVCRDCQAITIPGTNNYRGKRYCPECVVGREDLAQQIKDIHSESKQLNEAKKANETAFSMAMKAFDKAKDRNLQKTKAFQKAKEKFDEIKAYVESGKYKSHKEVIQMYRNLLKRVPATSKLYEEIEEEIDGHQVDQISDQLDKNRHGN